MEKIFSIQTQNSELEDLNRLLFSQDDIDIHILKQDDIKINVSDEDIKKYWEANKDNYKSQPDSSFRNRRGCTIK